jgi:hypothetical protein
MGLRSDSLQPQLPRYGFWSMLHEARADFDMLLGWLYLLIEGAGAWSLDAIIARKRVTTTSEGGLSSQAGKEQRRSTREPLPLHEVAVLVSFHELPSSL